MAAARTLVLAVHTVLLLAGLGYLALSLTLGATPDANIGAGLALLWLTLLAWPWSPAADAAGPAGALAVVAGASVNLGLHALLWWLVSRSRAIS